MLKIVKSYLNRYMNKVSSDSLPFKCDLTHFSASQLMLYQECPLLYWNKYINKQEQEYNSALSIGKRFHEALQKMVEHDNFETASHYFTSATYTNEEQRIVDVLNENLEQYFVKIYPKYKNKVVSLEEKFSIRIEGVPFPIIGVLDIVFDNGFSDYKTTSKTNRNGSFDPIQLGTYALMYTSRFACLPSVSEIHYFNKLSRTTDPIGVISCKITQSDIELIKLQYQQFYKDLCNMRFTPNYNVWVNNTKQLEETMRAYDAWVKGDDIGLLESNKRKKSL